MAWAVRLSTVALLALALAAHPHAHATAMDFGKVTDFDSAVASGKEQRVRALIEAGDMDKALAEGLALEKEVPRDGSVANLMGVIYLTRGDIAKARPEFERAVALNPGLTAPVLNLVQVDVREGKTDDARKRLQALLVANPKNVTAMLGLAYVAYNARNDSELLSWLNKATEANPAEARSRLLLASYYQSKGDIAKALSIAKELQDVAADNPRALETLGSLQLVTADTTGAVATFERWVRVAPNDAVAHYRLATAYAASGNAKLAGTELTKALAIRPDFAQAKVLLGEIDIRTGKLAAALETAKDLQRTAPRSPAGWKLEGDVHWVSKQIPAAAKAYQAAFALDGEDPALVVKLHGATSAADRTAADTRLLQWVERHPDNVYVRTYLAETYVTRKQNRLAIEQYERLAAARPNNVAVLNNLASLYFAQKDGRALDTAKRAWQLDPDNADVLDTLGWIQVNSGDVTTGMQTLQRALDRAPQSSTTRYHLAAAMVQNGEKARAKRELQRLLADSGPFGQRSDAEALLRSISQ